MAKTRDIRTRVAFEGETEYKKVVSDIAAEHKKLNNELKAAQAEFKATGNAEKMFEEKSKLLNKQIEAQNKAIKTAEDALKKLKDNGVEKNSAAWVYWEKELTSAKTAMFNATAELNKLNTEFGNVTSATERATQETADYTETLKSIDKGVKFGNILNGLRVVKDAVGGVISTAYRMGKALFMAQVSGGDWAREIITGAAHASVSVEEYQARLYAQAVSGIDTNAINEGITKTIENIGSTDEALIKLYGTYGIETRKVTGEARNGTEVFWETVDALKGISDETTRSIVAQKLLGDQFMELRALFDLGSEGYAKLIEEGKQNATITEESVKALSDMDSAFEQVKATAKATGHDVQAEFAPGFTAMAEAAADVLGEFNEFLDSSEGKARVAEWNETVSSFADTIKAADFKAGLEYAEGKLTKIASAFKTIGDTWQAVRDSWNFYETLFEEGPKAAIDQMIKSKTGENIASEVTFDDYLWQKNQKFIKEATQQPEEPQPEKTAEGKVTVFSYNPDEGFDAKKQLREISAAEEAAAKLLRLLEALKEAEPSYIADQLAIAQMEKQYEAAFKNENIAREWKSVIDRIDSGEIDNTWASLGVLQELINTVEKTIDEAEATAASGGGSAMRAFNEAMEKEGAKTENALGKAVSNAFSGIDDVFASMGRAHGAAYISALSSQMSRINSLISMRPTYFGSFSSGAQSAYASPTSATNLTASLYVGKDRVGSVFTPIINDQMGVDLQVMR